MKILFLTSGSVRSNFTYRALSLARELKELGHETAIVCPSADKYNGFEAEEVRELDGVRVLQPWQFKTKKMEINLLPYIFGALYLTLKEKPDVVYIYKPTPISIVGLAAKFLRKTPVVLDMDDLGSEVMKIEGHPKHQQKLVAWCEALAEKYSDRIVTASSYLFERYKKEFPQKPIHLMPNGIDTSWFAPVRISDKDKRIVYMGSVNRKNIVEPLFDSLPSIIKKYPDVEVLFMGDGKYLEYFKEKSRKSGIDKNIIFTGWLELEQARENLQAGDLGYGFMPDDITTRAASNMKTPQYMMRGVVPFVSRTGDLPKTVDEGRAGYISQSEKLEDIEAEILRALEDPERKSIKARKARTFAAENFSWTKLAKDFDSWMFPEFSTGKINHNKIFFVSANVPANIGGAEIRNLYLLRNLAESGKQVQLFCIAKNKEADIKNLQMGLELPIIKASSAPNSLSLKMRALLVNRMQPFMDEYRFSSLGEKIREEAEKELPAAIHLEQIEAYYLLRPHIKYLQERGVKIILDAHNVEAEAFRGAIENFPFGKKLAGKFLMGRLRALEIEATKNVNAIFACSESDAAYFRKYNAKVYLIANGVDCQIFQPTQGKKDNTLIFIGGTSYAPNADALKFYLREIHPQLRAAVPNVKLFAIGATKDYLRKNNIDDDTVIGLGFVDDIKPYLDQSAIGICPVRQGSGTRLKVLTFMASGLAVVSTPKGAEGINYSEQENILIADNADNFAKDIIGLFRNKAKRIEMGKKARDAMMREYDWGVIGKNMDEAYREILE
ncbi:MAG: glycosyltransferase [Candidatus Pacebacteria bacterium]|nr:glycosyltransferase [Candidatus Paceibacterota bacterium]